MERGDPPSDDIEHEWLRCLRDEVRRYKDQDEKLRVHLFLLFIFVCRAVAERLRHRSCDQKVASSIPRSGISVEVTSQC